LASRPGCWCSLLLFFQTEEHITLKSWELIWLHSQAPWDQGLCLTWLCVSVLSIITA
jgi:hypothetical protein